jgi:hypothetical protein
MRQESLVAIGPQMRVERIAPLLRGDLDHRPPAALDALLEELRKDLFDRATVEMVEENLQCPFPLP